MKLATTVTALLVGGSLLGLINGCGADAVPDGNDTTSAASSGHPRTAYYDQLALPSSKPAGLSAVRVEEFADPGTDGQRVQLVFVGEAGSNTVYVCSRPTSGQTIGATRCPYPGKTVLRVIDSADVQTVYALDVQDAQTRAKGGSASARRTIAAALGHVDTGEAPGWFVQMARQEAR